MRSNRAAGSPASALEQQLTSLSLEVPQLQAVLSTSSTEGSELPAGTDTRRQNCAGNAGSCQAAEAGLISAGAAP
jgi:hypothetical protein